MLAPSRLACPVLLALAPLGSADVLAVPGTFATVQAAVDAASPGDIVLVAPGNYAELVEVHGKGIALVADGGLVDLRGLDVRNVPFGQSFVAQGLEADVPEAVPGFTPGLVARSNAGSLRFDDCTFRGDAGHPGFVGGPQQPRDGTAGAQVINSDDVVFDDCVFAAGSGAWVIEEDFELVMTDGGPGLEVSNSDVVMMDCNALGGHGGSADDTVAYNGGRGGAGVLNREGGRVEIHGSSLVGGGGGSADCDGFFPTCGSGGPGGDGVLQFDVDSHVALRDNLYLPGEGGYHGNGSGQASSGDPSDLFGGTLTDHPATFRDFDASSPVREGQLLALDFAGEPGDGVLFFAALAPGYTPLFWRQGVFLLTFPQVVSGLFLGTLPASGELNLDVLVPELGVDGFALHMQAAFSAGGQALLGPAPTSVLLDAGL